MTVRGFVGRSRLSPSHGANVNNATSLFAMVVAEDFPLVDVPVSAFAVNCIAARSTDAGNASQDNSPYRYAQGRVLSQAVPVSREVAVFRRDTKQLLTSGRSGPNGFFHLKWQGFSGAVTVIAFDDPAVGYNAKVFDLVVS